MLKTHSIYRKKISVGLEVLSKVISEEIFDRKKVESLLKEYYETSNVKPFMGAKVREDIFDKEIATLYIIGKYGIGLDEDNKTLFEKIFDKELKIEKAIDTLLSSSSCEEKRCKVEEYLGTKIDSNEASRLFRLLFTKILFGFGKEEELSKLLRSFIECYPEQKKTAENYAKFYIAYRLSEMLYKGEIVDKLSKEIEKQAINLRLGIGHTLPDDKYIYTIAKNVFDIPKEKLVNILSIKE